MRELAFSSARLNLTDNLQNLISCTVRLAQLTTLEVSLFLILVKGWSWYLSHPKVKRTRTLSPLWKEEQCQEHYPFSGTTA